MKRIMLVLMMTLLMSHNALSHEWYEKECCSNKDCAPVTNMKRNDSNNGWWVTSKHGTVFVSDTMEKRISKDAQNHVCIGNLTAPPDDTGKYALCFYAAPGM